MSVELSLEDVLEVARLRGFVMCGAEEIAPDVGFVSNARSLRESRFSCASFVMRKGLN